MEYHSLITNQTWLKNNNYFLFFFVLVSSPHAQYFGAQHKTKH